MLYSLYIKNCLAFNEPVEFSMKANTNSPRFNTNVFDLGNYHILKSAAIYGPNNTGKSCLIKIIERIKEEILDLDKNNNGFEKNVFTDEEIVEIKVSFIDNGKCYSYHFKYNTSSNDYIYEKIVVEENIILERDIINNKFYCIDKNFEQRMRYALRSKMIVNAIDDNDCDIYKREIKNVLITFAQKIEVISMVNIPLDYTIELLKSSDEKRKKISEFVKNADLYMDGFIYDNDVLSDINTNKKIDELPLQAVKLVDRYRLVSIYKGKKMPSLLFDSTGTKKIEALASYIIEAIENKKILIIDELDSSLHFKLTRSIVSMFNNDLNTSAQFIFSTHDITLLVIKHIFRKEQIWFTSKDEVSPKLFSLDTIKESSNKEDLMEKYKKGFFSALPSPNLIESLIDIYSDKND